MRYSAGMEIRVPDIGPGYPSKGELIGPAWATAWRELLDRHGRWVPADQVVAAVLASHPVADRTMRNLLRKASQVDLVQVRYRRTGSPLRARCEYRVSPTSRR